MQDKEAPFIQRIRARKIAIRALEDGDLKNAARFMQESKAAHIAEIKESLQRLSLAVEKLAMP